MGWAALIDDGNLGTAPNFALDFPFIINGTVRLRVNENSFQGSISLSPNPVTNLLSISVSTEAVVNTCDWTQMVK